jgi:DNA anti-recombination protein RmuC
LGCSIFITQTNINMTQAEKAIAYDNYVREGDVLLREVSKLKSEYPINVPENIQLIIDSKTNKVLDLEIKLKNLF